jgi:hypothetical protein
MGTILMGSIIDRARTTLLENSSVDVRYTRLGELLDHGNASMREIVAAKPDACVYNGKIKLGTGAKLVLPEDGVQWFNLEHNLGEDGETDGVGIRLVDRGFLTRANRNWMTARGAFVEHYVHDQRDPKTIYVYPRPNAADWYVNGVYSAVPQSVPSDDIDDDDDGKIPIDDLYDSAMHDYIVGYALLKNSAGGNVQKATYFLQKFYNFIGKKLEAQMLMAPLDAEAAEQTPDAMGKP